jgi:nucleoside-diphosphate-sugar epimerase
VRALVTGSAGFAGRHFAAALEDAGAAVTGVDLAGGDDARDFFRRDGTQFNLVIHCAAVVGGRATIDGAPLALASNLELDAALFQWALRTRPGRIVYVSSSAAYPVALQHAPGWRLREDDIDLGSVRQPDQLYGWAKLTGEILAHRARGEDLAVTVVRPFSGYGEDQAGDYPFAAFCGRARRREDPFPVWGDSRQARDFIHIDDIVAATLTMAAEHIDGPVNLGLGRPVTMAELAGLVCAEAGYSPAVTERRGPQGVLCRVADPALLLGFYEPKITLEEGVARALRRA